MSWQERDYAKEGDAYTPTPYARRVAYRGSGMGTFSITTAIIIANLAVFLLPMFLGRRAAETLIGLGLMQADAVLHGQVWRLLTATYLHENLPHIFLNMLMLYFLGPALERVWGWRQFLLVYTLGGVLGNILITIAGLVGFIPSHTYGLGASGSVLTMLGAVAVLFPDATVFVYFLIPLRIRTFALLYGAWFVFNIFQRGSNYGGDLCHLAGLLLGVWWAYSGGVSISGRHKTIAARSSVVNRVRHRAVRMPPVHRDGGPMQRPVSLYTEDAIIVDQILAKIAEQGIYSLTPEEHRILREATSRRVRLPPPAG